MSSSILALDLGWRMGWAIVTQQGVEYGECSTPVVPAGQLDLRLAQWREDLILVMQRASPTQIRYELAYQAHAQAARVYGAMQGIVMLMALGRNLRAEGFHSGILKKRATGDGRAKKPEMITAAARRLAGWHGAGLSARGPAKMTDNMADAICLAGLAWDDSEIIDSLPTPEKTH